MITRIASGSTRIKITNMRCALLTICVVVALYVAGLSYPAAPGYLISPQQSDPFFLKHLYHLSTDDMDGSDGCTTALISGIATVDGRRLLWKNRDVHGWDQEFVYDDSGAYAFVGMTYAGVRDQNWGGVNEAGFAIGNANAWNLPDNVPGDDDDGFIILEALRTCVTVDDFEDIMDSTNNTGRTRPAIYLVIDAYGGMAMFEAADYYYDIVDLSDTTAVPEGFQVRANFSYNGGDPHIGQHRHDKAIELIQYAVAIDILSEKYMLRTVACDLESPSIDPYPLPFMGSQGNYPTGYLNIHYAICRDITTSMLVIKGVLPGEDPLLSTMWVMAGEPSHNIAVPLWVHSGQVPEELDGDSTSAICDRVLEIRTTTYDTSLAEDALDLWSFVDPRGGGLFDWLHPREDGFFILTDANMSQWRVTLPDPAVMAVFQDSLAGEALAALESWAPPKAPVNLVGYAHENGLRLEWDPVTEDIFNRSRAVHGYRIYAQDTPFEGRDIGEWVGVTTDNYFNFGQVFPYCVKYFRVTAFTLNFESE